MRWLTESSGWERAFAAASAELPERLDVLYRHEESRA